MAKQNSIVVAVKGVILHNGKVLIIKRADNSHVGGGSWECVGGKLEFGENLEEALKREISEEVGLDTNVERILYSTTFKTNPNRQVVLLTYLCSCKNKHVVLSEEHEDYKWATKDQLKQLLPPSIYADFEKNGVFEMEGLV